MGHKADDVRNYWLRTRPFRVRRYVANVRAYAQHAHAYPPEIPPRADCRRAAVNGPDYQNGFAITDSVMDSVTTSQR